jgi:polyphosphate glucokinase
VAQQLGRFGASHPGQQRHAGPLAEASQIVVPGRLGVATCDASTTGDRLAGMADPIGIDFGGTGIKAAPVDLSTGEFSAERERLSTPEKSTPGEVGAVMAELLERFDPSSSAVGVTIPAVVRRGGVIGSAANIDKSWIGTDADDLLSEVLGREVHVINDADAAGLAEARYGVARDRDGLVIVTTLGTGIGSALLYDGVLVPNTELGHLEVEGYDAESRAANSARKNEDLTYEEWAGRLTTYYRTVEKLFSPDLIVVGGGISKHAPEFLPLIDIDTEIVAATLRNTAGIVGAAVLATDKQG